MHEDASEAGLRARNEVGGKKQKFGGSDSKTRPLLPAIPHGFPRMPTTLRGGAAKDPPGKGAVGNLSAKMARARSDVEGVNHSLSGRAGGGSALFHHPQTARGLADFIVPTAACCNLIHMEILKKLYNPTRTHDPLYFLVHNYYISRHFTLWQRVQSAVTHHQFELNNYNSEYSRQVYRSSGVLLWERSVDNLHFTIVLVATEDNRHEGDLSVILSVDNIRLCRMSFCYLNARILGLNIACDNADLKKSDGAKPQSRFVHPMFQAEFAAIILSFRHLWNCHGE